MQAYTRLGKTSARAGGIAFDTLGWLLLAVIILLITVILIMKATPIAQRAMETIKTILAFI